MLLLNPSLLDKSPTILLTLSAFNAVFKSSISEFNFKSDDTLLFGRESAGVPVKVHDKINEKLKIPMRLNKRSLNLARCSLRIRALQLISEIEFRGRQSPASLQEH